jgi:hypothetical protein
MVSMIVSDEIIFYLVFGKPDGTKQSVGTI